MSSTRFVLVPLILVILIGLLIGGGWAVHRIGWTEGYAAGAAAAAGEVTIVPYAPGGLSRVALFLTAGLAFLVFVGFVGMLLRLWAFKAVAGPWMMAGGPWRKASVGPNGERWASHWRHFHRHAPPPWWCGWEQPSGEEREAQEGRPSSATTDSEAGR
jgi:hypothetical protein